MFADYIQKHLYVDIFSTKWSSVLSRHRNDQDNCDINNKINLVQCAKKLHVCSFILQLHPERKFHFADSHDDCVVFTWTYFRIFLSIPKKYIHQVGDCAENGIQERPANPIFDWEKIVFPRIAGSTTRFINAISQKLVFRDNASRIGKVHQKASSNRSLSLLVSLIVVRPFLCAAEAAR